jgi:ParB-like chromosome segregation protein Spo0J
MPPHEPRETIPMSLTTASRSPDSELKAPTRRLEDLKPHPRQKELIRALNTEEFTRLREDIRLNGMRTPVEITVDDVIIDGHQRVHVAKELSLKEVVVWVREDLPDQKAIDRRHLLANLGRRQLTKLDIARLVVELCRLEQDTRGKRRREAAGCAIRDRVGEMLGMCGRNVQRYLNVASAPPEIQQAFDAGRLSLVQASRVTGLEPKRRKQLVREIRNGTKPTEAVKRALPARARKAAPLQDPKQILDKWIADHKDLMRAVEGREHEMRLKKEEMGHYWGELDQITNDIFGLRQRIAECHFKRNKQRINTTSGESRS